MGLVKTNVLDAFSLTFPIEKQQEEKEAYPGSKQVGRAYRPVSKAGEASGESSAVMVKMPSNLRAG